MKPRKISQIVKKQIKDEIGRSIKPVIVPPVSTNKATQETTQSKSSDTMDKSIIPFLMATLGNRIINGYKVVRSNTCTGMQVYVTRGSAFFEINQYIELQSAKFITVPVYAEDKWVYIYLTKEGNIYAKEYDLITESSNEYIILAIIWVESTSTVVLSQFIIDTRTNKVPNLSELMRLRTQVSELYNVFPNTLIGLDSVVIAPVFVSGGVLRLHIQPNASAFAYIQGHAIILPEETIDLTPPGSGEIKDYYIVAESFANDLDVNYSLQYKQIEVGVTLQRYQLVLGRVNNVTNMLTEISAGQIDIRMQRNSSQILEIPFEYIWEKQGILTAGETLQIIKEVRSISRIKLTKVYLNVSFLGSGYVEEIIIDIKKNGVSIFRRVSGEEHKIIIPLSTPNQSLITSGDLDEDKIYLNVGDKLTCEIVEIPFYSGYLPEDICVYIQTVTDTIKPEI